VQKFKVRLKGFKFVVFAPEGKAKDVGPGDAVPVAWLERKVTPKTAGKGRASIGTQLHREWLLVEAHSRAEAEGLFKQHMKINSTASTFEVASVEEHELVGAGVAAAPAVEEKGKGRKKTADEAARAMLGGKVPVEE
jgi:hypothetical protein